ncbi:MAG: nucleotidyltransferase domain-containing protein [Pyrobaculum sp.]
MALGRWIELAKKREGDIAAEVSLFVREACREGDVVLFGSRARGTHHSLSDWDIAVISASGVYRVEAREFGQVFHIPLGELPRVLEFSMVVLDVAFEGMFLCGRGDAWAEFIKAAGEYVEKRRLVKTPAGWFPESLK